MLSPADHRALDRATSAAIALGIAALAVMLVRIIAVQPSPPDASAARPLAALHSSNAPAFEAGGSNPREHAR